MTTNYWYRTSLSVEFRGLMRVTRTPRISSNAPKAGRMAGHLCSYGVVSITSSGGDPDSRLPSEIAVLEVVLIATV